MKKTYTIIGIAGVVLLAVGFMYFVFGGASRGIQKVISDDGLAELTIPKNALPEGISINDISITNVSVDDTILAYEFKPDGTAFSTDLTFKTTFKNKDNIIPVPFLISKENGIEPVSGAETTLDLTKNEVTISMPMAHFSALIFPISSAYAFFSATMKVPAQVYIGDVVLAKVTLNKTDNVVLFSELNPWAKPLYNDENRSISGLGRHTLGYRLVRDSVEVLVRRVDADLHPFEPDVSFYPVFTGETLTFESRDYRCDKVGRGKIYFTFAPTYDAEAVDVVSDGQLGQPGGELRVGSSLGLERFNKSGGGTISVAKELECVARPTVESGTGSGVSESESKAVGDILDEGSSSAPVTPPPPSNPPGKGIVCGLPGGPACPPKK